MRACARSALWLEAVRWARGRSQRPGRAARSGWNPCFLGPRASSAFTDTGSRACAAAAEAAPLGGPGESLSTDCAARPGRPAGTGLVGSSGAAEGETGTGHDCPQVFVITLPPVSHVGQACACACARVCGGGGGRRCGFSRGLKEKQAGWVQSPGGSRQTPHPDLWVQGQQWARQGLCPVRFGARNAGPGVGGVLGPLPAGRARGPGFLHAERCRPRVTAWERVSGRPVS